MTTYDTFYEDFAAAINATHHKVYLALAGGGQSFAHNFMKFAGASNTIAGINLPYSHEALQSFAQVPIVKCVSAETSRLLAKRSFANCLASVSSPQYAIGIGLTCALATNNEREDRIHKIYATIHGFDYTCTQSLLFEQGATRKEEEELCCIILFNMLREYADTHAFEFILPEFKINFKTCGFGAERIQHLQLSSDIGHDEANTLVIMPGSFNPMHDGHQAMMALAHEITGHEPYAELSLLNVDKPSLDYFDAQQRFESMHNVKRIVTMAATFKEKTQHLAQYNKTIIFVVGIDTWERLLSGQHGESVPDLCVYFAAMNVHFLVFGRNGKTTRDYYSIMNTLLINDTRATNFDLNLSSTAIRAQAE